MKQFVYLLTLIMFFSCATINAQNYKTHKVKDGETIEGIAKKYLVTPYDIYSLNPDAKNGIKRNMVLIIPNSKVKDVPQATISKELIGFKEHKVKRRETLYSLSKKYEVEEDEIKKHNSFLYANNLRKGDKLKIPVYKKTLVVVEPESPTNTYTVLPKEGKWRIAYKYGITVNELEALNPDMPEILNPGDKIYVPNIEKEEIKEISEQYSYYEVLPKEGFYRLNLKLGLEQDELENLNPELKDGGLKEGMVLRIPFSGEINETTNEIQNVDLTTEDLDISTKHLAIMLPFRLNKVEFDSLADTKRQIKRDPYLKTSLDFYTGVLVALDSLKKLRVSLKVDVYDTRNMSSEISNIIRSGELNSVDAVIGPLMPSNIERIATALKPYQVPVVSPITKNVKLLDNVFQTRPSEQLLYNKVIDFIKKDSTINHMIVISDHEHTKVNNNIKRVFNRVSQVYTRKDKDGNDAYFILDEDLVDKIKPGKNLVFLETDNSGLISNVTSKLNSLLSEDIEIMLVTTNMNKAFEDDEVSNYHLSNLQFHFSTISKTYNEEDSNSFAKTYQSRFGITPNAIAVRGFDLTMDVVLRIASNTDLYQSVVENPLTEYVENKFSYKKEMFGGYYNNTVYLVKYDNLRIVEVE